MRVVFMMLEPSPLDIAPCSISVVKSMLLNNSDSNESTRFPSVDVKSAIATLIGFITIDKGCSRLPPF